MSTPFAELSDQAIIDLVEPLMDNCLDGSNEGDHTKHVRDFTPRLAAIVTEDNLASQLETRPHGYYHRREFVALMRKSTSVGVVWRQFCTAVDDEFVNHAIFVIRDNRILIDHVLIC
ncbi:MAG: hypothetical protein ACPG3T_08025 [Pseudomonadales bacterium]